MNRDKDTSPILVVVADGRWDAYSLKPRYPTPRDRKLFAMLKKMGGVNETVEPGSYHFNVERIGVFKHKFTLDKIED